jgi:hypothetical protein
MGSQSSEKGDENLKIAEQLMEEANTKCRLSVFLVGYHIWDSEVGEKLLPST